MGKKFSHLTFEKRIEIASYLKLKVSVEKISKLVGVHRATVYREIKRGLYEHLNNDLTKEMKYSPDIAHNKYKSNLKAKGRDFKIGKDIDFANFLEYMVVDKRYSPYATLQYIKNNNLSFKTSICKTTFYNYIDKDIFLNLTNKKLPYKKNKKAKKNKIRRRSKFLGKSIEKRPKEIENREVFGHWEMDCVLGKREKGKVLLVLTERKTRKEIVILMKNKSAKEVVNAIDKLEKRIGIKRFKQIFKTITIDNGVEFADSKGLERSCINNSKQRTEVYYCHPYSSWERGTNENTNKLIRRHLPKGTDFTALKNNEVFEIEKWINNYPRFLFNGASAEEQFKIEFAKLNIVI